MSLFIAFEGVDGSGKTTLINKLKEMDWDHVQVIFTSEPYRRKEVEHLLSEYGHNPIIAYCIYGLDRSLHIEEVIKPALSSNKVVICDRFSDSSFVYHAYGNLPSKMIFDMNRLLAQNIAPDLKVIIDIDPESAIKRIQRRDGASILDLYEMTRLWKGYKTVMGPPSERDKRKRMVLNGYDKPDNLARKVYARINKLLEGQVL